MKSFGCDQQIRGIVPIKREYRDSVDTLTKFYLVILLYKLTIMRCDLTLTRINSKWHANQV